jgi:hypothetical protein
MKKKQLVKSEKPADNVTKPLCGSFGGSSCNLNGGTAAESDILL